MKATKNRTDSQSAASKGRKLRCLPWPRARRARELVIVRDAAAIPLPWDDPTDTIGSGLFGCLKVKVLAGKPRDVGGVPDDYEIVEAFDLGSSMSSAIERVLDFNERSLRFRRATWCLLVYDAELARIKPWVRRLEEHLYAKCGHGARVSADRSSALSRPRVYLEIHSAKPVGLQDLDAVAVQLTSSLRTTLDAVGTALGDLPNRGDDRRRPRTPAHRVNGHCRS